MPVLGSQPAGDVSHKPRGRLPLLSARPAVTPATLKKAATNFAAWWAEARRVWTVFLRLFPNGVVAAIWTGALLPLSPGSVSVPQNKSKRLNRYSYISTNPVRIVLCDGGCIQWILWYRYHDPTTWMITTCHQQLQYSLHTTNTHLYRPTTAVVFMSQ